MSEDPPGRTYRPDERPDVVVETDDGWYDGTLCSWSRREDGWWGMVAHRRADGNYLDSFPAGRIHRVDSCPWYRGHSECLFECERGGSG